MTNEKNVESAYQLAKERYAELGVDTDAALKSVNIITLPAMNR